MSTEANKALARQLTETLHGGNADQIAELLSPDFVSHFPGVPQPMNREQYIQFNTAVMRAFPDFKQTVEDIVAEGDTVALRMTGRGTHTGVFQGMPPTGKQFAITGMAIRRIADGKIVEEWANPDQLGLMQQIGALPPR
jgi:steroid delta-isomerase-like uncharacterized protein